MIINRTEQKNSASEIKKSPEQTEYVSDLRRVLTDDI